LPGHPDPKDVVKQESITKQAAGAVNEGWMEGGGFLNSILAGTLLGLGADHFLGTDPWLVIVGIVAGSYAGFLRIWAMLKKQDGDPRAT
jgi:F0F1-type ATP synthase assembly protein I